MRWIRREVAQAIHQRQLSEHGGPPGIRDAPALVSALAWPEQLHAYAENVPDLPSLAAAYAFGIVQNHPFVDGNKRTAYAICRVFLLLNGFDIFGDRVERYQTFWRLAQGGITEDELAAWIRARIKRVD